MIPSEDIPEEDATTVNANMFRNLDSAVSEGGENFSTGWDEYAILSDIVI